MGGAVLVYAADRPIQDWVRRHPSALPVRALAPFREGAPLIALGSAQTLMLGSAALYVPGLLFDERKLREAGLGCAAAVEAGSVARHVAYGLVSRPRPAVTGDPTDWALGGGDWNHRSFWGGHGANLMTCSTFLATRFHLSVLEPVLYAAAVGVALGRVADLAHWPSDTFVGLVAGYAIGRLEARRVLDRRAGERVTVVPTGTLAREGLWVLPGVQGGVAAGVGLRF